MPTLDLRDEESLFLAWPEAIACPRWRLWGESPSPALLRDLVSTADYTSILRGDYNEAVGILQICEVDEPTASGYLSFLMPPPGDPAQGSGLLPFLRGGLETLALLKITIQVDEDVVGALTTLRPHVSQVGVLRDHALATSGQLLDRYIFEFVGEASLA